MLKGISPFLKIWFKLYLKHEIYIDSLASASASILSEETENALKFEKSVNTSGSHSLGISTAKNVYVIITPSSSSSSFNFTAEANDDKR